MARKFLSVLGTRNYEKCFYGFESNYETMYVQEALI